MFEVVRWAAVVAATVTTGLLAGVFFAFSVAVMPGLARVGDRGVVEVMQRINEAILNGWFLVVFLGSPVLSLVAVVVHVGSSGAVLGWLVAALVGGVVSLAVTVRGSVPLNDALAQAGPVERMADPVGVRRRFEARWVRWNVVRTVASVLAFGCLVGAVAVG
ncbi:DUF1772 domain-containing protein [Thermobifida halotolerans]|uniref:DUF1772 domain-containing protein n=1 Tax=Thermobifida halotolerans TaxID=483545 RepID=A0A399G659_9ACTN|nr:anthrone oxygenase family protein [Thermobifida halotolerans]UOE21037.1 DUF1772 domain-containing protein [Thermobifida halotolerans]